MNKTTITIQPAEKAAIAEAVSGLPADLIAEDQRTNDHVAFPYVRDAFEWALKNTGLETIKPVFFPWLLQEEKLVKDGYSYTTVMRRRAWEGLGVLSADLYRKGNGYALYCTPLNSPTMLEIAIQTHLHCIAAGWCSSKNPEPWLVNCAPLPRLRLEAYGDMLVYQVEFEHSDL